tara:strand:+ start:2089 stop:2253 length:165 start_codon:yes stop_codon:yes gene_type:complete
MDLPPHLTLALNYAAAEKFVNEELPKVGFQGGVEAIRGSYPESSSGSRRCTATG